ncbi:MAG TPA: DUF4040 domain-containing protein, partial [bacterium]|nr:DUF4040 domain-containing protein [bacterium]
MTFEAGILLALLVASALWAVMTYSLVMSAIGLGIASAMLAILMYELGAPMAAVIELSVCAGLITVVFISAISLTPRMQDREERADAKRRLARFFPLPLILAAAAWVMFAYGDAVELPIALPQAEQGGVREALWEARSFDVIGQIVIILAGAFAVVILFKNLRKPGGERR